MTFSDLSHKNHN